MPDISANPAPAISVPHIPCNLDPQSIIDQLVREGEREGMTNPYAYATGVLAERLAHTTRKLQRVLDYTRSVMEE